MIISEYIWENDDGCVANRMLEIAKGRDRAISKLGNELEEFLTGDTKYAERVGGTPDGLLEVYWVPPRSARRAYALLVRIDHGRRVIRTAEMMDDERRLFRIGDVMEAGGDTMEGTALGAIVAAILAAP